MFPGVGSGSNDDGIFGPNLQIRAYQQPLPSLSNGGFIALTIAMLSVAAWGLKRQRVAE